MNETFSMNIYFTGKIITTLFSFYKDTVYKDIRLGFCQKLRTSLGHAQPQFLDEHFEFLGNKMRFQH